MNKPQKTKITNEKPVSLFPLNFKEAVAALLKVTIKPPNPQKSKQQKQIKKPND